MAYRVAVDIGGTFTDFCVFDDETRKIETLKVLSTPDKPGSEIISGLKELASSKGIKASSITWFSHGTTVGINTVIQRRGARLALIVTAGFEDVLELARLKVPDPYNIFSHRPTPLVPRERVYGITERMLKDGSIDTPLDRASVEQAVRAAQRDGVDTIVVALLHSYANPEHERQVRTFINESHDDMEVTLSSDVWPVIREYERTVTATVAGYVQRRVAHYLSAFQQALDEAEVPALPLIGKSNGGVMSAEAGKKDPISMLLSGTAAGVIGAADIARRVGRDEVLSFDVGGTSADVAVIRDGSAAYGSGELVGEFPIFVPTVSVTSIGEGGGSIAWIDDFGVLKVGPESAGSSPGPACYDRGGSRPTITDAFATLGVLSAGKLGYGAVELKPEKARDTLKPLAEQLDLSIEQAAESVIQIAVSGMFLETSKLMSRQGADPRSFSLVAFGGAGPMTACHLGRELGLAEVIIPPTPGVLSAYGGLIADIRNDFIRTVMIEVSSIGLETLQPVADELEAEARNWLFLEQAFDGDAQLIWTADMRYHGQSYEIETAIDRQALDAADINAIATAFHHAHHRVYDHSDPDAAVQIVNLRLVVAGTVPKPTLPLSEEKPGRANAAGEARVWLDGTWQQAAIYDRKHLSAGDRFSGPAIIGQDDTTTIVLPDFEGRVDGAGNLILHSREKSDANR